MTWTPRMERILITGASGFIGSNLCRHFADASYQVFGLVRRTSDLRFLAGVPVSLVHADLAEPGSIDLPLGLDYVIHAASLVLETASMQEARRNTYETTRNLLASLRGQRGSLKRFVYISTGLVLGHRRMNISERNPGRPARGLMAYVKAKVMTENLLLQKFREERFPVVILRPTDVFGPNGWTSRRVLSSIDDGWPTITGTGRKVMSFCWVGNLATACELACRMRGADGAAYTVTNGQDITWRELMGYFQSRLGRRQKIFVPIVVAYAIACVFQLLHLLIPAVKVTVPWYAVSKLGRDTSYDISRTKQELGYEPVQDIEGQLRSIVDGYLAEKGLAGEPPRKPRRRRAG